MPTDALPSPGRGFTTGDLAKRYRVGEDRIRNWIKSGQLKALNTTDTASGRPRYVVTAESVAEFERRRAVTPPPKSQRRRKGTVAVDFYPD
jgi:transposase